MRSYRAALRISGFTLVELTIVLVIVALLIGGMLLPLSAQRDLQSTRETQKQLSEIKEALIGFAITNGRFPRPASSATDGTEQSGSCAGDDKKCTGFIPWQVLGIQSFDSWNKLIRYSVSPSFSEGVFTLDTVATKKIETRDNSGNLTFFFGQTSNCDAKASLCAPVVIFSQGRQRYGTTADGVVLNGTATSLDEKNNDSGDGILFISRTPTDNTTATGGEFDDIVSWISPVVLFNRMVAAGKLP